MDKSLDYAYASSLLKRIVQKRQGHSGPLTLDILTEYETDMRVVRRSFDKILKRQNLSFHDCSPLGLPQCWPVGIVKILAAYSGDRETTEFWKSYIGDRR